MAGKQGNGHVFSPEQRQLIAHFIETRSYVEAYRSVYPGCDDGSHKSPVTYRASKAFTKPMRAEIARLDAIAEEAERKEIERAAKKAAKKWSKTDAVGSLVNLVRKCERQIGEEFERGEGVNTRVADTMRGTIESLNKMMGYNEPEKQAIDTNIKVIFGGMESGDGDPDGSLEDYAE